MLKSSHVARFGCAAALSFAVACGAPPQDGKGAEEQPLAEGDKLDSFQKPTDHGALAFATAGKAELTKKEQFHAWTFSLSGDAALTLRTTAQTKNGKKVDTVVYLYKQKANGAWGSYIGRNDDDGNSVWSKLERKADAGNYRVIVKGYASSDLGKFSLFVDCAGNGCAPVAPAGECVFGTTFNEMPDTILVNKTKLTVASPIDALTGQQIVSALHASSHTDVTTVAEAFAAADQGEVNQLRLYDLRGARAFTAYEYGAGDNSYGRYFAEGTVDAVADIHDGDIMECKVNAADCLFGQTYQDVFGTDRLSYSQKQITSAAGLSATEQAQLVRAVQVAYTDASTVAEAFSSVDQGEINFVTVLDRATNKQYVAFEYGAGDNSYGALFLVGEATPSATIHDGDLYECRVWR